MLHPLPVILGRRELLGRRLRSAFVDNALHGRGVLLHRGEMIRHGMRRRVVRGFRWVIVVINTSLLFSAAHVLSVSLLLVASLLFHAALIFVAVTFRRAAIRITWRGGWAPMPHVIHASPSLFASRLLDGWLIFPLPHPLGSDRWGSFMFTVQLRTQWALGRRRAAGFHCTRSSGFLVVRRVGRLVLWVCRLRRWHAVVMHRS